jgi:hypothetical protein
LRPATFAGLAVTVGTQQRRASPDVAALDGVVVTPYLRPAVAAIVLLRRPTPDTAGVVADRGLRDAEPASETARREPNREQPRHALSGRPHRSPDLVLDHAAALPPAILSCAPCGIV